MPIELPDNLKSLAAELDAFAGRAGAPSDDDAAMENIPRLDGTDYVLLRKIGEGGMGTVQTLTSVLTDIDRLTGDKRGDELLRAQRAVEALAGRFPENGAIKRAAWQIEQARGAHARVKALSGRASSPRSRPQPFKR